MERTRLLSLILVLAFSPFACTPNRVIPVGIAKVCRPQVIRSGRVQTSGFADVSKTTRAVFALTVRADSLVRGYIAFARGSDYWFEGVVSSGGPGNTNDSGIRRDRWLAGSSAFTVAYDSATNSAEVLGQRIALDTARILLIDRVDGVGGPPRLMSAVCPREIRMDHPVDAIVDAMLGVRAFVVGSAVPNTR